MIKEYLFGIHYLSWLNKNLMKEITVNNGYLGSYNDEERSEMW